MKTKLLFFVFFAHLFFSLTYSQNETRVFGNLKGLKVKDVKLIPDFSLKDDFNDYFYVTGVIITNSLWKKQTISLETICKSWQNNISIIKNIEVLPNSRKKFSIYINYHYYWGRPILNVIIAGKTISSTTFPQNTNNNSAMNVLYVAPKNYIPSSHLSQIIKNSTPNVHFMSVLANDLPDSWLGYSRVNLVILNSNEHFLSLSEKKEHALLNWLRAGGNILVSCGSDLWLKKNTFMDKLFDVENIDPESLTMVPSNKSNFSSLFYSLVPSNRQYNFAHPKQKAKFKNLLWHIDIGYGKVTYLGADFKDYLEQKPSSQNPLFWSSIAKNQRKTLINRNSSYFTRTKNVFIKERGPLSALIVAVMLLYFLIIGPINFHVLKKKKKSIYLIFSIPIIALTFSLLILSYGFFTKGINNIGKKISLVHYLGDGSYYSQEYLGISSGSKNFYTIQGEKNSVVLIKTKEKNAFYKQIEDSITLFDYPINLWESKFFFINTIKKDQIINATKMSNNKISLSIPDYWGLSDVFFIDYKKRNIRASAKIKGSEISFLNGKLIGFGTRNLLSYWKKYGISGAMAETLARKIGDHVGFKQDFVLLFIKKEISTTTVSPEINVNEHLNVVIVPVNDKG